MDHTKEIETIKRYATDSITFGKKSGNETAIKRGNAVLKSATLLSVYIDKLEIDRRWGERADTLNLELMNYLVDSAK